MNVSPRHDSDLVYCVLFFLPICRTGGGGGGSAKGRGRLERQGSRSGEPQDVRMLGSSRSTSEKDLTLTRTTSVSSTSGMNAPPADDGEFKVAGICSDLS